MDIGELKRRTNETQAHIENELAAMVVRRERQQIELGDYLFNHNAIMAFLDGQIDTLRGMLDRDHQTAPTNHPRREA